MRPDPLRPLLDAFARDGSASAMETIVRRTRRRLLGVAKRIGAPQDADDTVQAAYHALLRRPAAPTVTVEGWLVTATVRIAYRKKALAQRAHDLAARLDAPAPAPETSPSVRAVRQEEAFLLRREIDRLPAKYRDAVVLFHLQGLSAEESARLLEVPRSTVTTRLSRARALLRSRLGPRFAHGLVLVPWFLADHSGALGASLGGLMKAKTVALVAGVGLVTGSVGALVGAQVAGEPHAPVRSSDARFAPAPIDVQERDEEIRRLRARVAELQRPQKRTTPSPSGSTKTTPAAAQGLRNAMRPTGKPVTSSVLSALTGSRRSYDKDSALAAARARNVSAEELEVARKAYRSLANAADPERQRAALAALRNLGDKRADAVVAVLAGLTDGPAYADPGVGALLEAGAVPGREQVLVEALAGDDVPSWAKKQIIKNLDRVNVPVVRDYLVRRLEAETDPWIDSSLAMTLGRMKEERAVPHFERQLRGTENTQFNPYYIYALSKVGGPEASRVLVDHARRAPAHAVRTLNALAEFDRVTARREAGHLLRSADIRKLPDSEREKLEKLARGG